MRGKVSGEFEPRDEAKRSETSIDKPKSIRKKKIETPDISKEIPGKVFFALNFIGTQKSATARRSLCSASRSGERSELAGEQINLREKVFCIVK